MELVISFFNGNQPPRENRKLPATTLSSWLCYVYSLLATRLISPTFMPFSTLATPILRWALACSLLRIESDDGQSVWFDPVSDLIPHWNWEPNRSDTVPLLET